MVVAFLLGGLVKGTVGIGLPTISLAVLSTAVDLPVAVGLMAVPALCTNLYQAVRGGAARALVRRHWGLLAGLFAGVWLGTVVLFRTDPLHLAGVLGLVLCLYTAMAFVAIPFRVPRAAEPVLGPIVGASTGLVAGATGAFAFPLMVYVDALRLDKDRFVQFIGLCGTVLTVPLALGVTGRQMWAGGLDPVALGVLAPSFAGLWLGQRVRSRFSARWFRRGVLVMLLLLGLNLVRKGFL